MSETGSTEDIVEEIHKTEDRLADAVEALAYKKGHLKDDVKEAVVEKKDAVVDQVKEKVGEKKEDLIGAVKDKIADAKEGVASKVGDAKDAVASKLPGGGGDKGTDQSGEGLGSKIGTVKDTVVSKIGDLKGAVADKLPGGRTADESTTGEQPTGTGDNLSLRADAIAAEITGVEVIPVDEQGRPQADAEQTPAATAQELRGLAGELRAEGQRGAAELAEERAAEIEHTAEGSGIKEYGP